MIKDVWEWEHTDMPQPADFGSEEEYAIALYNWIGVPLVCEVKKYKGAKP